MNIEFDSKNNKYIDLKNIRISYVDHKNRPVNKNWPGADVIRIQAYRGDRTNALHQGAELPISNKRDIVNLIDVLVVFYKVNFSKKNYLKNIVLHFLQLILKI